MVTWVARTVDKGWAPTLMALAGSAQRCLSKLLSSGRGEAARFGGAGQALG